MATRKGKLKGRATKDDDDKDTMAFKVLSETQTSEISSLQVTEIQEKLKEILNLEKNETDLQHASMLDYFTSAIHWGIQQKFTAQQLSGFFTVVHTLLDNVKEKHMPLAENANELKKMLVGIGLDDVKSAGLDFFNVEQAKLISDYIYTTFFQHYKLYLYLFSCSQAEEIIGTDLEVEVAKAADVPFPPPLDEGVTEDMHRDFIATPPPTPSPEPGATIEVAKSPKPPKSRGSSRASSRSSAPKSRASSRQGSSKKRLLPEEQKPDPAAELEEQVTLSDAFADLTANDVREVIESVAKEMFGGLQTEVASKLKEKENQIIQRINKIHKVAD